MFAIAHGVCFACKKFFGFNPKTVPSHTVEGKREPICESCVRAVNQLRIAKGKAPFVIAKDAYIECKEEEL